MWAEILEHDNSIHTVFNRWGKSSHVKISVNITVSFGAVSHQENIKDMNRIVLKWKRCWPKLHWWGHHYKQFIPTVVGELCSSSAQQQTQSYNSSTWWGNCSVCSHYLWVNMNFVHWWTGSKDQLCGQLVLLLLCLCTLFFGATVITQCTAKWWVHWMISKHGSLQQLQMLQRTSYSESGKRWTTGGIYAELEMVLTVKHSASNNNSTWCKKTVSVDNYTVSTTIVIHCFPSIYKHYKLRHSSGRPCISYKFDKWFV